MRDVARDRERGFTLLELIVVIAVVGILAAIAYPSFVSFIVRSDRSEARAALMAVQLAQERFRMSAGSYAPDLGTLGVNAASERGLYQLQVTEAGRGEFTVRATATAGGRQERDVVACQTIQLRVSQGGEARTPPECW